MLRKTCLLVLVATISLVIVPSSKAASTPCSGDLTIQPVATKFILGDSGTIYTLDNPFSTNRVSAGIWYAKYEPNGRAVVSPTTLRNSTEIPMPLTGYGKIVVWPSIPVDNESVPHVVWMEKSISAHNRTLSECYGTIKSGHIVQPVLSQYGNQSFVSVPPPQMIYDEDCSTFQMAWAYSQQTQNAHVNSQVSYASVDTEGNETRRIAVADLKEPVRASTARAGNGSAFAIWQVSGSSLGIMKVKTRILTPLIQLLLGISAFSAMGLAFTDEGKYRFIRSLTSLSYNVTPDLTPNSNAILHLLTQKPGSRLREIKHGARASTRSVSLSELTRLERAGYVSSVRVGFSRRFFENNLSDQVGVPNRISSMILNEIRRTPGTWEGKIARDLNLSQQIVHYHVKRMRSEGLLDVQLQGRRKLYRFANSSPVAKT